MLGECPQKKFPKGFFFLGALKTPQNSFFLKCFFPKSFFVLGSNERNLKFKWFVWKRFKQKKPTPKTNWKKKENFFGVFLPDVSNRVKMYKIIGFFFFLPIIFFFLKNLKETPVPHQNLIGGVPPRLNLFFFIPYGFCSSKKNPLLKGPLPKGLFYIKGILIWFFSERKFGNKNK